MKRWSPFSNLFNMILEVLMYTIKRGKKDVKILKEKQVTISVRFIMYIKKQKWSWKNLWLWDEFSKVSDWNLFDIKSAVCLCTKWLEKNIFKEQNL